MYFWSLGVKWLIHHVFLSLASFYKDSDICHHSPSVLCHIACGVTSPGARMYCLARVRGSEANYHPPPTPPPPLPPSLPLPNLCQLCGILSQRYATKHSCGVDWDRFCMKSRFRNRNCIQMVRIACQSLSLGAAKNRGPLETLEQFNRANHCLFVFWR